MRDTPPFSIYHKPIAMKNQVVVSIDPMNVKHSVIEYAEELARAAKAELLIYSVQGMPMLGETEMYATAPHIDFVPGVVEEAERIGQAVYEKVKERYPLTVFEQGLGFQATATIGKMEEVESEGGGCLLVMPKTGDDTWWNNVVGSTEISVASEVKCPVLFVPDGVDYSGISRILYLADTQALMDGKYKGFRFLRYFSMLHAATVAVGFITNQAKVEREQLHLGEAMDKFHNELPFQFHDEYRFFLDNSADEILQMASLTRTDIVAFPYRESSIFRRFFENEITRTLVLKANIPVLVF